MLHDLLKNVLQFFFSKDKMVLEKVTKKLVLTGYTHVNLTISVWRRTCFISFIKWTVYVTEIWGESFGVFFRVFAQYVGLLSTYLKHAYSLFIWFYKVK